MNFAGIIAEYDPFHNGHALQLQMLRRQGAGTIAVCMSSGAVQRGGVPLLPEPVRVLAALQAGADLVVALPAPYANAGAEAFAAAGVYLLGALGCDTLAFGAETPSAPRLMQMARLLLDGALQGELRRQLATGCTFAAAREAAVAALCPGEAELLREPNNILGIEYCKAILQQGSAMTPCPLPRLGAAHGADATGRCQGVELASASLVRAMVYRDGLEAAARYLPTPALGEYRAAVRRGELLSPRRFSTALLALLRSKDPGALARVRGVSEGLENRLQAAIRRAADAEQLYDLLKTKRYPHARLRRLALDAAMDVRRDSVPPRPPYLHLLGARRGALARLKQAALPVSTSLARLEAVSPEAETLSKLHNRFTDFSALCREETLPMGLAYTWKPVIL